MKRAGYGIVLALLVLGALGAAYAQMPSSPINLTAKEAPQLPVRVELHWTGMNVVPMSVTGAYRIYRSVDDSLSFKFLSMTTMTGYTDLQVVAGHTYFYFVTSVIAAIDSAPRESSRSNIAWVTVVPPGAEITGTIAGTVTDSVTGKPVPYAGVTFYRPASPLLWLPRTVADSAGHYTAVLDTGTYLILCTPPMLMGRLNFSPVAFPLYKPKWYKDAYDPAHATPVRVTDGGTFTADFALARFILPTPVHVRGTVRDSAGMVLKGARVVIMRTVQEMHRLSAAGETVLGLPGQTIALGPIGIAQGVAWTGRTDSTGAFDATVLSQHSYIAMAADSGYLPQFYDHKSTPLEATQIAVTADVSGIDFNLLPWRPPQMYAISGVVRDSSGVRVPSRIVVFPIRSPRAAAARFAFSDSLGAYTVDHLLAGKYIVLAVPFADYAPAFYKAGAYGVIRWKDADTVTVAANVTGIDIGVVQIHWSGVATLSGSVTSGGAPLEGVNVLAQDAAGAAAG